MKRNFAMILTALALTVSLSACGNGSGDTPEETVTSETEEVIEEIEDTSVSAAEKYTFYQNGDYILTDEAKMIFRNNIVKDLARHGIDENIFDQEEWYRNTQYTYADEIVRASLMYYQAALGEFASEQFTEEFKKRWIDEQEMSIFDEYTSWDEVIAESCCLTWAHLFGSETYDGNVENAVLNYLMECNDASGSSNPRPAYFFNVYDGYSEDDLRMIKEDPLPTYETSKKNQESVQTERDILAELKAIPEE